MTTKNTVDSVTESAKLILFRCGVYKRHERYADKLEGVKNIINQTIKAVLKEKAGIWYERKGSDKLKNHE